LAYSNPSRMEIKDLQLFLAGPLLMNICSFLHLLAY
jgi:hypothetical protein